ncbi:MAG: TDT family transporter [Desulfovibrionaceae bacterium]
MDNLIYKEPKFLFVRMKSFLRDLPVALTGLALGFVGICNVWAMFVGQWISIFGAGIAIIILFFIGCKNIICFTHFLTELSHPLISNFIPTYAMALMVVSSVLVAFLPIVAKVLWVFAIIMHFICMVHFFYSRRKVISLDHILPSWFVPPVGIVVACVTAGVMGETDIARFIFFLGFTLYMILLPVILYRVLFAERISDAELPTFAIIGAPANLCLAGVLTVFPTPNPYIVSLLLALAVCTTFLVYLSIIRMARMTFTPLFASFTFPLAIGATAILLYANYLERNHAAIMDITFWKYIGYIELVVATCVIAYVVIAMSMYVYKNIFSVHFNA